MNVVITGSLGNIGRPLTIELVKKSHSVTVISSSTNKVNEINSLGAKAAIGNILDGDFLTKTFIGADIVYLMEPSDMPNLYNKNYDIYKAINEIVSTYKYAIEQSGVKKIIHLSSVGAHAAQGVGMLAIHYNAETLLKQLPGDVAIKFMRAAGFYYNLLTNIETIKSLSNGFVGGLLALQHYGIGGFLRGNRGIILTNYGGDVMNLLVSPNDIASVISEEIDKPFEGRSVRYIASEELTCNEVAKILGEAIGKPYLKWGAISDKMLTNAMLKRGMNASMVKGIVEMGAAGRTGFLYEDYYKHRPVLSKTKLKDYAKEFAVEYNKNNV
jgi:uncharacterized protein YbjT (DUF2867 family)